MKRHAVPAGSIEETYSIDVEQLKAIGGHGESSLGARGWSFIVDYAPSDNSSYLKCSFSRNTTKNLGPLFVSVHGREEGRSKDYKLVRSARLDHLDVNFYAFWHIQGPVVTVRFTVKWGPGVPQDGRPMLPQDEQPMLPLPLWKSLSRSITSGSFMDTRFFAYSRRQRSGRVDWPRPVYASSTLLKENSPYFQALLSKEGFSESSLTPFDNSSLRDDQLFVDEYDYESDSDLEDELPDEANVPQESKAGMLPPEPQVEETGIGGDSVLVNTSEEHHSIDIGEESIAQPGLLRGRLGCTVFVKDAAHKTFCALVHYLYTGKIRFARLTSENPPDEVASETADAWRPPPCSPKSMYRLADELGLEALKQLAFDAIQSSISENNIIPETFSKFTSLYDEVQKMEVNLLSKMRQKPLVQEQYTRSVKKIAEGELPHSAPILASIFVISGSNNA
ncbi:hypothetical protein OE88DRAFT_1806055 [Heliocybe sulcata]|uniref:BTB domain-containing protein n=1 Tax=Heliocybe sulcata TaxID=5364 RepID=A0A5C3NBN1_9AGAM|nr:hypothetical protein OE88DRAFT_1806055 [Heliocybe sulcata]